MKTRHLLTLAICAALCCSARVQAATALGLTAEEMTQLYGADFARQTSEAQKLMDEEWDADMEEEKAEEVQTEEPAPETPQPAEPAADDSPEPDTPATDTQEQKQEPAAETKDDKAKNDDKAKSAGKKKIMKNTILLVKTKRAVDAKIKYSRNNITTLRKKLYGVAKKYDVRPSASYCGGEYSSRLKNLDLIVVKNSQEAIQKYKDAIPQLWAFSNELNEHIEQGMKTVGKTKNKVLLSFKPGDILPQDGSETEKDLIDKFNYGNINSYGTDY
ncbi:MAG: hypothetical protein Q4C88_07605 [Akkermansia sp.]|nr:hypothetical protein [Akkermansia sp.]